MVKPCDIKIFSLNIHNMSIKIGQTLVTYGKESYIREFDYSQTHR